MTIVLDPNAYYYGFIVGVAGVIIWLLALCGLIVLAGVCGIKAEGIPAMIFLLWGIASVFITIISFMHLPPDISRRGSL